MKKTVGLIVAALFSVAAFAQDFEPPQDEGADFDKTYVSIGADFAMQYQSLSHSADSALIPLGSNINLPTANFNIYAALAPGMHLKLVTYLSSRHHVEAWVKGGYLMMDELPFLKSDAVDNVMDYLTLRVGVMEVNYGDAHFRRSDNGNVMNNPFVGNYIMDAFTTAPAFELYFRSNGWMLMGALSSGSLRPDLVRYNSFAQSYTEYNFTEELAYYFKGGFDKTFSEDFRLRTMLSGYFNNNHHFGSLYYGDRAGSRYYLVMQQQTDTPSDDVDPSSGHTSGRWGPGFTDKNHAYMANLFAQYKGFEFFGTYEMTDGTSAFGGAEYSFSQYAVEGLYRFGGQDQFYAGARYNHVENDNDQSVDRMQIGGGWFITDEVMLKLEYVDQNYENFISQYGEEAGFKGFMFEAAVSI